MKLEKRNTLNLAVLISIILSMNYSNGNFIEIDI
jgi:hypothetical protein